MHVRASGRRYAAVAAVLALAFGSAAIAGSPSASAPHHQGAMESTRGRGAARPAGAGDGAAGRDPPSLDAREEAPGAEADGPGARRPSRTVAAAPREVRRP